MKVYHLRTSEQDKKDPMGRVIGLVSYTLESIYVPDRNVLVGFLNWGNRRGKIFNYSDRLHCERAAAIVNNNRDGIQGDVIGEVNLDELCVASITSIPRMPEIRTTQEFDGTTDCLVNILSGKYLQAPEEKKKRVPFLRRVLSRA